MTGPFAVVEQDGEFVITSTEHGWQVVVLKVVPYPYGVLPVPKQATRIVTLLNKGHAHMEGRTGSP